MANICNTIYKITGETNAFMNLYKTLKQLNVFENDTDISLYQLAEAYNIDYEKRQISVRGHIYYADYAFEKDDDYFVISIETDTAWTGCHDLFHAINQKLNGNLSISYRETEPGCNIYCVHDEGDFFPEECMVAAGGKLFCDIDGDCFQSVGDAINEWCETMNYERKEMADSDMLSIIENYEYEDENTFFNIHVFTYE